MQFLSLLTRWGRDKMDVILSDDIFKWIFLNENVWILIKISLKFVFKGPINNIPALVQIMGWRQQATSHYLNQWWLVYWRIYASLGLNELMIADIIKWQTRYRRNCRPWSGPGYARCVWFTHIGLLVSYWEKFWSGDCVIATNYIQSYVIIQHFDLTGALANIQLIALSLSLSHAICTIAFRTKRCFCLELYNGCPCICGWQWSILSGKR